MDLFSSQSWTFFGIHDASNSVLLQEGAEEFNIWPFLLISVILILSILFDTCKEVIESNTPEAFEPIMDAFFSELATLGFIGAIAFTLTYNFQKSCEGACSIMQRLSEKFLGEPGELQEIFEGLHFLLFAVSVVFIFTVLILLRVTLLKSKQWADWEYELTKSKSYTQKQPESGKDTLETKKKNFLQSAGYSGSLFDLMSFNVDTTRNEWKHSGTLYGEWIKPDRMARSEFYRLRHRFIQDHQECVETIIPLEFDFGMYLKLTLAHTYAKIIEIKPVDWLVLWILFGVVFFAYYLEPLAIIFTFIAVEFLVLVSAIALQKKLINIRYEMLPPMLDPFSQSSADFEQEESSATSPLLDNNEIHEDPPEQAGENKKKQNQLHIQFLGEPKYQRRSSLHISKPNNPISAMFSSQRLNRHQQLFWFGSHGPSVMVHACKLLLFGSVINLAVVFVELQAALPAERKLLVLGLALVSPVLTLLTMPLTIQTLNLVTNIEHMKSEKILVEVIKHQKFQKQRKVMQMLSSLQFFIDKAEAFATERFAALQCMRPIRCSAFD
uniref:MLO-like protein n=1 Tax=Guillardia theta TaxID=55529 RepID=A0A6U5Z8U4_GUITH|mmetsp:Transcript_24950/g.82202  ORF Transcript_24950/g.82202 Transcript_24950/m.82202 type:complete len:553 (+) Transcript_24950:43-1701(+)